MRNHDVPSPIDFSNPEEARKWVEDTTLKRPWRPEFFRAFASQIARHLTAPAKIVELGAGPGMLAEEILKSCLIERYMLVDFSAPMLDFARHRLKRFDGITQYIREDFRSDAWTNGLTGFDAVVTMQAVHEVRHKRHAPQLYTRIFCVIRPGG